MVYVEIINRIVNYPDLSGTRTKSGKGRDFYDLWFILKTNLPIDLELLSQQTQMPAQEVWPAIENKIARFSEKQLAVDLNPFMKRPLREWIRKGLKKETLERVRGLKAM